MRSSLPIARKKLSKGFIVLFLALVSALAGHPAYADSVGDEFKDRISGNVQFEGTPLEGVLIKVSGQGYEAEVVTDAEGKWRVGVPSKGDYQVTLIEDTLPEGIAVLEGGSTQLVTVGPGGRVSKNFFIGEGERITVSLTDQVIARIIYGLNFGLMLALAAIGLSLVFGTTGLSNFAHSEMVTFGAITSLILVNVISMPIWLALPLAVVISGLMGWGLDAGLWTPLRRKGLGLVQLMIVSIGLSLAARYVYQFIIGGGTEQLPGATAPKMQLFGAVVLSWVDIASMAISLVAILIFAYWLIFTKIGKATRAISDNASLAAASGIDVDRVIRIVWILAAALAGLAGILWAYFRPGI
ncbi:MAG: ABC transporter permease subunit, partial [Candidatus Nanopelagicales bacterium]